MIKIDIKRFFWKCILPFVLLLTIITGCSAQEAEPEPPPPTPTPAPEVVDPVRGGNLKLSMRIPHTLNPILNQDATVDTVLKLVFEHLAVLDENQKPRPNLADSFDFASDGLSLVVNLRRDVYWSDGRPMTANDLIFTLDTLLAAPEDAIYKQAVRNMTGKSKLDDYTVKIHYSQPFSGSAYLLCFPLIPSHYYTGEKQPDSTKNMSPLGNGLYTFVSYVNVREMTLAANETYFRGRSYIDNITSIITPDAETDLYSFDQGIIDAVSAKIADWGKYRGSKTTVTAEYATTYFDFIGFNFSNVNLQDIRIRQAVAHATPVDQILDEVYLFHALKTASPVSPASWLYNSGVKDYAYDLDLASDCITEAGFVEDGGVLRKEQSGIQVELSLHILVNEENEERIKIANILAKNLNELKISSQVEALPFEEFESRLREGKFDLFVGGYNLSMIPDLSFAFHSSYGDRSERGANFFGYRSEEMDILLEQAFSALGDMNYKNTMGEVQRHIAADLPCVSLVFRKSALLTDQKVKGELKPLINNVFTNINEWFILEEN